jgi:prepilin signal peptidase PulO-like enzyme (type II secretory pathway)
MQLFTAIIIAVLGACVGSFLSVIIHRLETKQKGIFFGKSMCPNCKKPLKWGHLIPVLSFLFLRGKCAYCKRRISRHYIMIELLTAFLFTVIFLNWNFITAAQSTINPDFFSYSINWETFTTCLFYLIEAALMVGIFFYDLKYKIIPDSLSIPAILIALAFALITGTPEIKSFGIALGIIIIFFGGQILLSKGKWLGGGDLRLGALLAFLLGAKLLAVSLIISYFIGALASIALLLIKKATRKTAIPFGPFLITGGLISLFFGEQILTLYFSSFSL